MSTNTTDHGPTVEGYEVVELVPAQDVAALVAELDRLREALRRIEQADVVRPGHVAYMSKGSMAGLARAALAQSKEL